MEKLGEEEETGKVILIMSELTTGENETNNNVEL